MELTTEKFTKLVERNKDLAMKYAMEVDDHSDTLMNLGLARKEIQKLEQQIRDLERNQPLEESSDEEEKVFRLLNHLNGTSHIIPGQGKRISYLIDLVIDFAQSGKHFPDCKRTGGEEIVVPDTEDLIPPMDAQPDSTIQYVKDTLLHKE